MKHIEWMNEYILFRQGGHWQGHELQKLKIKKVTLDQIR